jgi:hypothetical protein
MTEQDEPYEDDPSTEWVYNKEMDMWISLRQQIAIEGSMYRRMVSVRAAEVPEMESAAQPPDQSPVGSNDREGSS